MIVVCSCCCFHIPFLTPLHSTPPQKKIKNFAQCWKISWQSSRVARLWSLHRSHFFSFQFFFHQFISWCSFSQCVCVCSILFGFFYLTFFGGGACCVLLPPLLHPPSLFTHLIPLRSKKKEKKEKKTFFSLPPEFFLWDWACKGKKNVKCYVTCSLLSSILVLALCYAKIEKKKKFSWTYHNQACINLQVWLVSLAFRCQIWEFSLPFKNSFSSHALLRLLLCLSNNEL